MPYFLPKIKSHEDSIDEENPRDFLDQMIIESRQNPELSWVGLLIRKRKYSWFFMNPTLLQMVMTDSLFQLYVAAVDTLTNTMRWFVLVLSLYPGIVVLIQKSPSISSLEL